MKIVLIEKNHYADSIILLSATACIMDLEGVHDAVVVMGNEMSKSILQDFGALTAEAAAATANDLIIAVDCDDASIEEMIWKAIHKLMEQGQQKCTGADVEKTYPTLKLAAQEHPDVNLAVISLPGEFAAAQAATALDMNMHCFIFSDNVPLEDEIRLKKIALEKDLLVMGPGCGVSIINNISLGLMSKVRRGPLGIVGASGSGMHEIAMIAHRYGVGISQAIGTGGRDLSEAVGGITMCQGIQALDADEKTKVIVLVSKPPHPQTEQRILAQVSTCHKPVVVFFLGGDRNAVRKAGAYAPSTLEEAALMAVALCCDKPVVERDIIAQDKKELAYQAMQERAKLKPEQKYIRGVFCGGTHSEESVLMLKELVPELHSNLHFGGALPMEDPHVSMRNALTDMGDETFTKGKPHPVMDPSLLVPRLLQEAADPETAVILFDVLTGYGAHEDPVGVLGKALSQIRTQCEKEGRHISLVCSLCGTDIDPQGLDMQRKRLEELDVWLLPSNAKAAIAAGLIVGGEQA